MGFVHFLRPHGALFWRDRARLRIQFFQDTIFSKNYEPCAHDAHIIFLFPAIILLAVLAPSFQVRSSLLSLCCVLTDTRRSIFNSRRLMLADRSLFFVARNPLISTRCFPLFVLVATDFSLLAGLLSLYTAHGTSSCALVVSR